MKYDKTVYFDTFNVQRTTAADAITIDLVKLYEAIIFYDRIIISLEPGLGALDKLLRLLNYENLLRLLKNNIIVFSLENVTYKLSNKKNADFIIGKPDILPYEFDIDEVLENIFQSNGLKRRQKRELRSILHQNMQTINFNKIDKSTLSSNIIKEINDKQIIAESIKLMNDFMYDLYIKELLENAIYKVVFNSGNNLHMKFNDDISIERKNELFSLVGARIFSILRGNVVTFNSLECNATSIWGNPSTEAVIQGKLKSIYYKSGKTASAANFLINLDGIPNIKALIENKQIDIKKVMKIRGRAKNLRELLFNLGDSDENEIRKAYLDALQSKGSFIEKSIRFAIPTALGATDPIIGAGASFLDNFLIDKFKGNIRVSDIFDIK
ncbi:hypothetical protein [Desulfuribacillus alkaliarsenatis]|uniref:Uncharacterized protein n=1 Tax=Desulfuribacillus alkaliarsenatis TaxID=766136 RepID=A0A1E5FZI1_9FIRM|nr:hypothetical protein [Desulfuribacillus alkaliarsenatis]OEF95646.1 hypothetical protein BHF68_12440 [Desulfuribacillus alkaliarsenatis]